MNARIEPAMEDRASAVGRRPPSRLDAPAGPRLADAFTGALRRGTEQAGEMVWLLLVLVWSVVRRPTGYWTEVKDRMSDILRLCWFPMIVATTVFGLGVGLGGLNLYLLFGIPERLGSLWVVASIREFGPWINAMVVAGIVGTAVTADLGARVIREEIDALRVLGIDPVRRLVLPRVIALFVITGLLDLVAIVFGVLGGFIAAVGVGGASPAHFIDSFWANATTVDLVGSLVKTMAFGLIIGIVCCYKGMTAQGGPAGVGRAVNQAVVIAFASIWAFNYVFTTILLGLNPEIQVFK
ncbi:ABC transporter permease [Nitriliruptor alkaliphilus]|uniref:ABC transporter permease n=1 Tax=Nitriliruptor alkaliphilus TaxID=427918 RepID=UPI000AE68F39|nr:ABC transporter permease [Nitriliruptor alkaliphilus]